MVPRPDLPLDETFETQGFDGGLMGSRTRGLEGNLVMGIRENLQENEFPVNIFPPIH